MPNNVYDTMTDPNQNRHLVRKYRDPLSRILVVCLGITIVTSLAGGGVVAATGTSDSTTISVDEQCDPPLDLEERAVTLQSLLTELDSRVVRQDTLSDVNSRIERGEQNMNRDRYCDAKAAYKSAIAIAEPTLNRAYPEATRNRLDEVDAMIAAEEADGNPDPDVGELRERSNRLREDLDDAESLSERQELYQRSEQLKADTESQLPTTLLEQSMEAIIEAPFISGIAILFSIIAAAEAYALTRVYKEQDEGPRFTSRGD